MQPKRKHPVSPNVPAECGGNLSLGHLGYLCGSSSQVLLCHWESFARAEGQDRPQSSSAGRVPNHRTWWPCPHHPHPSLHTRGLLGCGAKCRLLVSCPALRQVQWPGPPSPGPKVWASPGSSKPSTGSHLTGREMKVRNRGEGGSSSSERWVRHRRTQKNRA